MDHRSLRKFQSLTDDCPFSSYYYSYSENEKGGPNEMREIPATRGMTRCNNVPLDMECIASCLVLSLAPFTGILRHYDRHAPVAMRDKTQPAGSGFCPLASFSSPADSVSKRSPISCMPGGDHKPMQGPHKKELFEYLESP